MAVEPALADRPRRRGRNLAEVLDFPRRPNLNAPQWDVPAFTGLPCPAGQYVDYENWNQLAALAQAAEWAAGT